MINEGRSSHISKESIFSKITQKQVFEYYLNISITNLLDGTEFCNPLRKDHCPTCTFKVYPNNLYPEKYIIWFRDWSDNKGYDCIGLVQKIANNCSFYDALCLISHHFHLLSGQDDLAFKYILDADSIRKLYSKSQISTQLRIKKIPFERNHLDYWKQYNLDLEDLEDDVTAIKCYWLITKESENRFIPKGNLGFAYLFGGYDYKIYNPLADIKKGEIKHLHTNINILQGENKLEFNKDLLIITSSYKDVKVLRKIEKLYSMNYETVASMSESTIPNKVKVEYYKTKYRNIVLYYNNDKAGIENMKSQSEILGINYIVHDLNLPKDISDISKYNGFDKAVETINNLIL